MAKDCALCGGPVNPHDQGTWKQVQGWVHGPKSDSMTLREYTERYAHQHCIGKAKAGQSPDQPSILDDAASSGLPHKSDTSIVEEFFDGDS